jgi:uncharacterized CHY-type Zn-finger protein
MKRKCQVCRREVDVMDYDNTAEMCHDCYQRFHPEEEL